LADGDDGAAEGEGEAGDAEPEVVGTTEEGSVAEKPLKALLHDRRPAPVWGSEGVMVYQQYHFRVCDYAWALLSGIKKTPLEISESPEARDKLIEAAARK